MRRSKLKHPPHTDCDISLLQWATPCSALPPGNDASGHVVSQGTISQYSIEGGRSACTSICLVACGKLIRESSVQLARLASQDMDVFVQKGVKRYRHLQNQHSSVDDLWGMPYFTETIEHMEKGDTRQGSVARRQDLIDVFQACIDFAVHCDRLAIVLTKSGETVLCLADLKGGPSSSKWYLFDSHGQSHENPKLASWKEFDSFSSLLEAFLLKYPPQDFGDASLQADMYNLFEAVPIVDRRDPVVSGAANPHYEDEKLHDDSENMSVQPTMCEINTKGAPDQASPSQKPVSVPFTGSSLPSSRGLSLPPELSHVSNFRCSISLEIMADPVVCSDGKAYDRPSIEQHFHARREQEEERIAHEEARARGEENVNERADECCCNADRPPIVLTSPITGQPVDGIITPVQLVEQQIISLVQINCFQLSEEELADWHERREEKKRRDLAREQAERQTRERTAEMRRHAAEAAERRPRQSDIEYVEEPPLPQEAWLQVRIDRDTNEESERLGEHDLGLSVVLAGKCDRIPIAYAAQGNQLPRCMVACCAATVKTTQWCARCARLICDDCLGFGATNIGHPLCATGLSRICFECVSQLIDAMDSPSMRIRRKRAIIIAAVEKYLTQLSNRAATKQDTVVRLECMDECRGRMEEVESAIRCLGDQLQSLRDQVRLQEKRASDAAADAGVDNFNLLVLRNQLQALQREYDACLQEQEAADEEEMFDLVLRLSEVGHRLEIARTIVAMEESSVNACSGERVNDATSPEIRQDLDRLQRRLDEIASVSCQETVEEQMARTMEVSSLCARIEELSISLASEASTAFETRVAARASPLAPPALFPSLSALVKVLERYRRSTRHLVGRFGSKRNFFTRIVVPLRAMYDDLLEPSTMERRLEILTTIVGLLPRCSDLGFSLPNAIVLRWEEARHEVDLSRRNQSQDPPACETKTPPGMPSKLPVQEDSVDEDVPGEYARLSTKNVDELSVVARLSGLDAIRKAAEADFFQNEQDELPSPEVAAETRQDIQAIGSRQVAWPLPLGLDYPTPRMQRQLEVLRSTMGLRLVESKRSVEAQCTDMYNALVIRRDELEDEVAEAQLTLEDAEMHAQEQEERRRQERQERRRRDEEAAQAREKALREEARRAQEAAELLQRQHAAAEAATTEAFANARGESGAQALGGRGDLRMCHRCRAGPYENKACADLSLHNNDSTFYDGDRVTSVKHPNACLNCGWFHHDWRQWPYWDGIYGAH
jgi:hypothetical protein